MRQILNTIRKHSLLSGVVFLLTAACIFFTVLNGYSQDSFDQLNSLFVLPLNNSWRLGLSIITLFTILLLFYNTLKKGQTIRVSLHFLAFLFSLFIAYVPSILLNFEGVFAFLFSILSLRVLLQIHNQAEISHLLFKSAMFAGIATLIYFPNGAMVLLLFFGAIILRPLSLRNGLNLLIGFLLPLIYLFSAIYLLDLEASYFYKDFISKNRLVYLTVEVSLLDYTFMGLLVLSLIGAGAVYLKRTNLVVNQRNQLTILFMSWAIFSFLMFVKHPIFIIPTGLIAAIFIESFYRSSRLKFLLEVLLISAYAIMLVDLL